MLHSTREAIKQKEAKETKNTTRHRRRRRCQTLCLKLKPRSPLSLVLHSPSWRRRISGDSYTLRFLCFLLFKPLPPHHATVQGNRNQSNRRKQRQPRIQPGTAEGGGARPICPELHSIPIHLRFLCFLLFKPLPHDATVQAYRNQSDKKEASAPNQFLLNSNPP